MVKWFPYSDKAVIDSVTRALADREYEADYYLEEVRRLLKEECQMVEWEITVHIENLMDRMHTEREIEREEASE